MVGAAFIAAWRGCVKLDLLSHYAYVQSIAKAAMSGLQDFINEGISEREIASSAVDLMRAKGIERFWYHGVGAFVHVGQRTTVSESGKAYRPTEALVGKNDIVTVDLSPVIGTCWGDYARTFAVINGKVAAEEEVSDYTALHHAGSQPASLPSSRILNKKTENTATSERIFTISAMES